MTSNQKMIITLIIIGIIIWGGFGYMRFMRNGESSNQPSAVSYNLQTGSGTTNGVMVVGGNSTIAYISNTTGVVVIERASQKILATPNFLIEVGDAIKSDATGTADIIFTDSSLIRLSPSSLLTLTSANEVRLDAGGVWARILKPLRDSSVFTIKTDDLSAAVRGTAVKVTKSASGSEAAVIDSSEWSGAVEIETNTSSGAIREVLAAEETLIVLDKEPTKRKLDMNQILSSEENRKYLKQDLVYLEILKNEQITPTPMRQIPEWMKPHMQPISTDQYQKIDREILASLPSPQELNQFFDSNAIKNEAIQLNGEAVVVGSGGITPEEKNKLLIELVQDDMNLGQLKKQLQDQREKSFTGTDPIAKEAFEKQVNELESSVRNFDSEWSQKNRDRMKQRQEWEKTEQTLSGSQVVMPVPVLEPAQNPEAPVVPAVVKPIEKPKVQVPVTELPAPRPTLPTPIEKPADSTIVPKPPIAPVPTTLVPKPAIIQNPETPLVVQPLRETIKPRLPLSGSAQPLPLK